MHRFETIDLGTYRGEDYFAVGFVEPQPDGEEYDPEVDAENYGVSLVQAETAPTASNHEIVRLDTAHGHPHLDKLYVPQDADENRKRWFDADWSYEQMMQYVLANWKAIVDMAIAYETMDSDER